MTALSALRKARAMTTCWDSMGYCHFAKDEAFEFAFWYAPDGSIESGSRRHKHGASALLDGFSVAAVTRAEEALEREARRGR